MRSLVSVPLDQTLARWWVGIDRPVRSAFFIVVGINLLAFGFEMTNLSLHHDDVHQILIQTPHFGEHVGRFGLGLVHYYIQNAYYMPFFQMLQGILFMSLSGILLARFWGLHNAMDLALVAAIMCVFPYFAEVYQFNTSMATYTLAYLLASIAVILSARATVGNVAAAAVLYVAAFSLYQIALAHAVTAFGFFLLAKLLFEKGDKGFFTRRTATSTIAVLAAVVLGGIIYVAIVRVSGMNLSAYEGAEEAFTLKGVFDLSYALENLVVGTRAFLFWPTSYFPHYLKILHQVLLGLAAVFCLWVPKGMARKATALMLLGLLLFAPRILQLMHPHGSWHDRTLTGYAVLVAGLVMVIARAAPIFVRNLASLLVIVLLFGYILQSNWISTVGYLNMLAQLSTYTEIMARIRSIPDADWDGKTMTVVGRLDFGADFPYRKGVGIAKPFIDAEHFHRVVTLMRDPAVIVDIADAGPKVRQFALTHPIWPHPDSVGIVDGVGVVVLSDPSRDQSAGDPSF